jgi:hypothetical protein
VKNNFTFLKNKLLSNDQIIATFDYGIKKTLQFDNSIIIILFDPPSDLILNQNLIAINKNLEIIWRVQAKSLYPGNAKNCPFIDISKNKEENLIAYNWCSYAVILEVSSGKVILEYETK